MSRGWLVIVGFGVALSLAGCGESKLAKMKRAAGAGNPDDPPPTNITSLPAPPPAKPAVVTAKVPTPPTVAPPVTVISPMTVAITPATNPPAATPIVPPAPIVAPNKLPASALSADERRARTITNLFAIAAALETYMQNSNSVPAPAFTDEISQAPLLSWRVAILPQLGQSRLYNQFKLDQRWDSPHNRQLLHQIPPEFQSPERLDEKTNYVCLTGATVAMAPNGNRPFTQFKDGLANTILLVEADDGHAVPWTQPSDLSVNLASPPAGLGKLRGDGFFAILASAHLCRVPAEATPEQIRALFTFAGGDGPKASEIVKDPAAATIAAAAALPTSVGDVTPPVVATPAPPAPPAVSNPQISVAGTPPAVDLPTIIAFLTPAASQRLGVMPVPAEPELRAARDLLREVYAKDYAAAKRPAERQKLATQLIADAATVLEKPAEQYEMLRIARDLALQAGDLTTAQQALTALDKAFAIDALALRAKTLRDWKQGPARAGALDAWQAEAKKLASDSLAAGQFAAAGAALEIITAGCRARGDKLGLIQAEQLEAQISAAKLAQTEVDPALSRLAENPTDAAAHEIVGKYLCLICNRWDLGLPLLARGEDIRFKFVATIDLEANKTAKTLAQLGDQYWQLAEDFRSVQKTALQARASKCYGEALPNLSGSLERIKIQKRMNELSAAMGKENVDRLTGTAPQGPLE